MLKYLFFFSLYLIAPSAKTQPLTGSKGFSLHSVPFVLMDRNPRLRLGIEYHRNDRLGYSLELGWGNHSFLPLSLLEAVWGKDYSIFEIRPEVKWYRKESSRFEAYYAAELFYNVMTDRLRNNDFYPKGETFEIYYDEASFQRQKIGFLLRGGNKWIISEKIVVDVSSGFGFAYRNIQYTDIVNPQQTDRVEEWFIPPFKLEGKKFIWQLNYAIKIGFRLR